VRHTHNNRLQWQSTARHSTEQHSTCHCREAPAWHQTPANMPFVMKSVRPAHSPRTQHVLTRAPTAAAHTTHVELTPDVQRFIRHKTCGHNSQLQQHLTHLAVPEVCCCTFVPAGQVPAAPQGQTAVWVCARRKVGHITCTRPSAHTK
jgi:hypothetical protein